MEIRVLGPVEITAGGGEARIGPPQQSTVLAALVADAGRLVPVDTLLTRVWGDDPPDRARRTLQTHLARIRRLLAPGGDQGQGPVSLVRRPGGYLLDVDPDRVDLYRFRGLVDRARYRGRGEDERLALLREAVGLWRGEPLAGLHGDWVERTRLAWRQEYLDATVLWARAELRAGDPAGVIGPLTALVGEHPLVESLGAMLMRALHAAGHTAQALELYAGTRRRLVDELGIEPGTELREAQQEVLGGDRAAPATTPATAAPPAAAAPVVPAQLPPDLPAFSGRSAELARLDELLAAAAGHPTAAAVWVVSGTAGVGKTALAVHWAHRVRAGFPDGQLYVNLRGFDPGGPVMSPAEAVRGFLDALGLPPRRIPAGLDAQVGLYRSLLAGRRVLVVLDNAANADQVRPLLPGTAGCLALVTSRNQLGGLVAEGAGTVSLDLLDAAEARELLTDRLGLDRVAAEPAAVDEIIARCARLPLALSVIAARAVARPRFPLAASARELRDAREAPDAFDVFDAGDAATDVRSVFSWSYRQLGPDEAALFRLLGLVPSPDISTAAAASLAGVPGRQVRAALAELVRAHLVTEHAPGRYTMHDLLRAYAAELAHQHEPGDPETGPRAAMRRLLDHYLHTAHAGAVLLDPHRDPIEPAPVSPGVSPEDLAGDEQAVSWFTAEHAALLAAVELAARAGFNTHAWQLAWTLMDYLDRRGHWRDWTVTQRAAVEAARRLNDRAVQARAHRGLAAAFSQLGRFEDANTQLRHALHLFGELGDRAGQAVTHHSLALAAGRQGCYREALDHGEQALDLYRATGRAVGEARALNSIGWYHAQLGDHRQAVDCCERALALFRRLGEPQGEAASLDSLGYVHHRLGDYRASAACYRRALDLHRDSADRYGEAIVLGHLAETHRGAGDVGAARDAWREALLILDDLGHPDADRVRAELHRIDRPSGLVSGA